ncbi:MAG: protoheme IX farnesyltransferase [Phycisphaeraceae bacterium]|nr:protoheme IX farnesyltransferase [Phycisphaeraceae bacterium]
MSRLTRTTAISASLSSPDSASPTLAQDVVTLTKARLTLLVIVTAWLGFALGYQSLNLSIAGIGDWMVLLATLLGVCMASMGAGAINQVMERDADRQMRRTGRRPVAARRMTPGTASAIGIGLIAGGLIILATWTTPLAVWLTFATVMLYTAVYTPLKRLTWIATPVGALPGAIPPLIGFAAATGTLATSAWVMFAIMVAWQMPHFYAIAWLYRDDYARGGFPMLPVIDTDGRRTFRQILLWCIALLAITAAAFWLGTAGWVFLVVGLLSGGGFLMLAIRLIHRPSPVRARVLFLASLVYLPIILACLALDHG